MDVEGYRAILGECFPGLTVSDMAFIGGGSCRVFEVNGELIFRFPHGAPDGGAFLRRERAVTGYMGPRLPIPIPRYEYYSEGCALFPWPVAGYRKLAGQALETVRVEPETARGLARQVGGFLAALHGLPAGEVGALASAGGAALPWVLPSVAEDSRAAQAAFYEQVRRVAWPVLDAEERAWTAGLFEPFLAADENWRYRPVPVHGDLDSSNLLVDSRPGGGWEVVGVIDFEEARLGDPAWDFCALAAEYGMGFVGAMREEYGGGPPSHSASLRGLSSVPPVAAAQKCGHRGEEEDEGFERRIGWHARRILFHELLYGLEQGAGEFAAHGRARLRRAMVGEEPIGGWLAASTAKGRRVEGAPE